VKLPEDEPFRKNGGKDISGFPGCMTESIVLRFGRI
jgi:hypothetical protein